ncbi:hypothetical protein E2C01_068650 [Portunus trituberculatus]|uniref:Uncharacterized protein n=1 Tax=Portunus trituberculatus TaxID=210409 RepID=A0A5B7HWH0_PORTR|nr:hypothetical protein [Portunus trituberculatus]
MLTLGLGITTQPHPFRSPATPHPHLLPSRGRPLRQIVSVTALATSSQPLETSCEIYSGRYNEVTLGLKFDMRKHTLPGPGTHRHKVILEHQTPHNAEQIAVNVLRSLLALEYYTARARSR